MTPNCLNCEDVGATCYECGLLNDHEHITQQLDNEIERIFVKSYTSHTTLHKDADNYFFSRGIEYKAIFDENMWEIWKWCDEEKEFSHSHNVEDHARVICSLQFDL